MNLVVDDAVEVRLATKTEEEKRRSLGMDCLPEVYCGVWAKWFDYRSDIA